MDFLTEFLTPLFVVVFFIVLLMAVSFIVYKKLSIKSMKFKITPNKKIRNAVLKNKKLKEIEIVKKLILTNVCTHKDIKEVSYYCKKLLGGENVKETSTKELIRKTIKAKGRKGTKTNPKTKARTDRHNKKHRKSTK
jgi:hypothetical protein